MGYIWGVTQSIHDIAAILRQVDVLKHASTRDIQRLAQLGLLRTVEEDGFFFFQDDPADHVYVLTKGRVKLCQITLEGQQVNLRTIIPYQIFGAVGAINPTATYPACAQALEDSAALSFESHAFRQILEESPALMLDMMNMMTAYIREMQNRYREMATEQVERRIARVLLRLASQLGKRVPEGVELIFSRQELAEMAGTTLYTVSRVLSGWEKRGLIITGRERVVITQPHTMVRLAEGTDTASR